MPVPTNRNKILPARGNYSDLDSNKASLLDGEICYAIDQDQYYQKEGSVLVAVGATKAQGTKADTAVQPGANISVFTNNAGYLTNASLEISNADDVNITSIEEDQVLLWDGSDFVNGSAPVMVEVKNTTGSTISKGAAVYVSGTHTSGKPLISLADNNGSNTYPAIGLAHKDIANGDEGHVTVSGVLFNINTSFSGWSAGDALYLSDTPGALTNTRPTTTAQKVQKVALVTRVHATAGSVIVIGAGRTNDIPNDLVTLTGVSLGDSTLGTFTGTTISDNESIKDALQTLETAVENASAPSNVLTTTTTFSGDVSGTYNNISIDDGPGSGLDADTVDSLQATSFLRSDASDTFDCNGNNLQFNFDASNRVSLEFALNGSAQWTISHTSSGADINFDRVSGSGQVTIENSKVWYAGNDGAGSGLDADTLDGLSSGDFLRRNATTTFNCNGNNLIFDFDTSNRASLQFALNGTAQWNIDHPNSGADLNFDHVSGSGQVTIEGDKVWYAGNDGASSGLDADTVDGIQAASFLRSDANDTVSGNIDFTSTTTPITTNAIQFNNSENSGNYYTDAEGVLAYDNNFWDDTEYGTGTHSPSSVFTGNNGGGLLIKNEDGWGAVFTTRNTRWASAEWDNLTIDSNQVWHAGNDGASSGLDADTVDGLEATSFLRANESDTYEGNGASGRKLVFRCIDGQTGADSGSSKFPLEVLQNSNVTGSDAAMAFHINGNYAAYFGLDRATSDLFVGGWSKGANKYKIWHAGNDGASSGLDADTLDGIDSGSFLRSDAADTTNNDLTISKNGDPTFTVKTSATSGKDALIKIGGARTSCNTCDISMLEFTNEVATPYTMAQISAMDPSANSNANNGKLVFRTSNAGTLEDRLVIPATTGDPSYNGNKLFHAGNDGAGSGLDADTLDGLSSNAFLKADGSVDATEIDFGDCRIKADNHRSGLLAVFNDTGDWSGYQIRNGDWEYAFMGNGSGTVGIYNDNNNEWILKGFGNGGVELRHNGVVGFELTGTDSAELGGNTIWHAGNDGAGTGLDADTLDGQQGSYYLDYNNFTNTPSFTGSFDSLSGKTSGTDDYSTTGNLISGRASGGVALTINDGHGNANVTFNHVAGVAEQNGNSARIAVNTDSTSNSNFSFELKSNVSANTTVTMTEVFKMTESGATCLGNTVWHAGSDGAGSGLDADTVDGIQASNFLRSDASDTTTGNITISRTNPNLLLYGTGTNSGNYPTLRFNTANNQGIMIEHNEYDGELPIAGYGLIVTGDDDNTQFPDTGTLSFSVLGNIYAGATSVSNLSRVLTTADEGASNGLDADTVDGIDASGFLRSNAYDQFDGQTSGRRIRFRCVDDQNAGSSTGNLFPLEVYQDSNGTNSDAAMAFHISNGFATYFGLNRATNDLFVGGWSNTTNKYRIWHAGNDGAGSTLDADSVDGIGGGSFLRSDANDSFTGAITGSGTILTTGTFMGITGNGGGVILTTNDGGGNANVTFNHQNAVADQSGSSARVRADVDSTTGALEFQVGDNVSPSNGQFALTTCLKLTTSAATFYGNTAWHAGNDGSGSGLDADTLDGLSEGSFLRSNAFDRKSSGSLRFNDNVWLQLGSDGDTKVYHNGTNAYIENNTGKLFLRSDGGTQIMDSGGNETHILTVDNAQVELYHNNSKRLNTTAAGVEINSSIEIIDSSNSVPFIDFKNSSSDDFDSRILANPNALKFYTGGNGNTAEHFQIASNGDLTATDPTISQNSDSRLKTNVSDFTYSLEDFKQYQPKTFDWRNPELHGNKTGQRGFIAQDVEAIDDYWVGEQEIDEESADAQFLDEDRLVKTLKLGKKDAMYVSVIQQALAKIEALETTVSNLQARVTQLETT